MQTRSATKSNQSATQPRIEAEKTKASKILGSVGRNVNVW